MKQGFRAAVLLGALLAYGLGAPVYAATDAKKPQSVAKKSGSKDVAAAKQSGKAAVPADKSAATKTGKAPVKSAGAAGKAPVKSASRAAPQKTASDQATKKAMRKVSVADVDPRRLMLYSASALVIDQETGQPLVHLSIEKELKTQYIG